MKNITTGGRYSLGRVAVVGAIACVLLATSVADAATMRIVTRLNDVTLDSDRDGVIEQLGGGKIGWRGSWTDGQGSVVFNLTLDPDPGIAGSFVAINGSDVDDTFMMEVMLPVTVPVAAGSFMSGSSSITVNDADFDSSGVLSAPVSGSIYEAKISGVTQWTLFNDPYSLSAPPLGTNGATQSFFGEQTLTAIDVGDVISIKHTLVLGPGDAGSANSNFFVIPEPGAVVLALSALAAIAVWMSATRHAK